MAGGVADGVSGWWSGFLMHAFCLEFGPWVWSVSSVCGFSSMLSVWSLDHGSGQVLQSAVSHTRFLFGVWTMGVVSVLSLRISLDQWWRQNKTYLMDS